MTASFKTYLGNGLYTVAEAAMYARVSPALMSRWLFGTTRADGVIDPQFGRGEKLVSFLDLIQTLAIREIRIQRKVPLVKFKQAIKTAKRTCGLDHPFARQHFTYLLGDELVIKRSEDDYIEASGKHRGHPLLPFVEMYLQDLSFDKDGLANKYQINIDVGETKIPVVMDPRHRFGEPLLPSGYSVGAIWDSIKAEGRIDRTAEVYRIPKDEVEASYRYFVDHLGKTAA